MDPRPIFRAALAFFAFFSAGGSIVTLGYPHPLQGMVFGILTNALSLVVNLMLSFELDRHRLRTGRDSWRRAAVLAAAAALASEPLCWAVARLPFLRPSDHPHLVNVESLVEQFLTYLLWALMHVFIRSGERALAQERRIAAVREAMLEDSNETLLLSLNPGLLLQTLARISADLRRRALRIAGETVIALAEHMRATLSEGKPAPPAGALDEDLEPDEGGRDSIRLDEALALRRFRLWTTIVWLWMLAMVFALEATWRGDRVAFLLRFAPQPVLGALWSLAAERLLGRSVRRPLMRIYLEGAGLCVAGLGMATAVLYATTIAVGMGRKPYVLSEIPGLEFFYMAPAFLAWTAAWFVLDARRREVARLRSAAEVREAALKARNAMLRQQINPHFLFNALNALYALVLDGETARAQDVIAAIRNFVERAGDPAHGDLVALSSELATQDAYLEIERVRFGARLQVERDVASELQAARVPHLILQPLVENAIKYGVSRTDAPVRVEISATRSGEELVLQVRDTGAPEAAPRPPGLGVGLKNVEGRLRSLYGDAGRLACRELAPSGFLAEVRLPLVL